MALKHAEPGEVVNLLSGADGTAALVKSDRFEAVRLFVAKGKEIRSHKVEGFITLLCLEGHARLDTDRTIDLRSGDWIYLDRGEAHSVEGVEDSTLLLTILFE